MKRYIQVILLVIAFSFVEAQTIVKMTLPTQANEPLNVVILFDEQVPEGMPVVVGLMGYNVTGGIGSYTYQWVQNGNIIGTSDVVVITPKKGDLFLLKVIDKNKCYNTTSFNMKVIAKVNGKKTEEREFKIYPTLIEDESIHISLPPSDKLIQANVRIFDLKGNLMFQTFTITSFTINYYLPDGTYFVSVKTDEFHKVAKIIVQH